MDTLMTNTSLNACPFCAGVDLHFSSNGFANHFSTCNQCGAEGPAALNDQAAADLWNNRAVLKSE